MHCVIPKQRLSETDKEKLYAGRTFRGHTAFLSDICYGNQASVATTLFLHLVGRICRITAFQLLHGTLDGVPGILPVGVGIAVVEFLHQPGNVLKDAVHVLRHQIEEGREEAGALSVAQVGLGIFAQVAEVIQAEAFAGKDLLPEFTVLYIQVQERIHRTLVHLLKLVADITGVLLGLDPGAQGIVFPGGCPALEEPTACVSGIMLHLLLHFFVQSHQMRFQNPGVAEGVAVFKHLAGMIAAEACTVRHVSDVRFHIGCAVTEYEIHEILFQLSFDEAEGTFVIRHNRIIQRDCV